jgi:mRNA interferase MazF
MEASSARQVALIPFPFSDLSNAKLRPALVVGDVNKSDLILAQITSNPYSDPYAIELNDQHFQKGSLQRVSYVRPGKLFTSNEALIRNHVGTLETEKFEEVIKGIIDILRGT